MSFECTGCVLFIAIGKDTTDTTYILCLATAGDLERLVEETEGKTMQHSFGLECLPDQNNKTKSAHCFAKTKSHSWSVQVIMIGSQQHMY